MTLVLFLYYLLVILVTILNSWRWRKRMNKEWVRRRTILFKRGNLVIKYFLDRRQGLASKQARANKLVVPSTNDTWWFGGLLWKFWLFCIRWFAGPTTRRAYANTTKLGRQGKMENASLSFWLIEVPKVPKLMRDELNSRSFTKSTQWHSWSFKNFDKDIKEIRYRFPGTTMNDWPRCFCRRLRNRIWGPVCFKFREWNPLIRHSKIHNFHRAFVPCAVLHCTVDLPIVLWTNLANHNVLQYFQKRWVGSKIAKCWMRHDMSHHNCYCFNGTEMILQYLDHPKKVPSDTSRFIAWHLILCPCIECTTLDAMLHKNSDSCVLKSNFVKSQAFLKTPQYHQGHSTRITTVYGSKPTWVCRNTYRLYTPPNDSQSRIARSTGLILGLNSETNMDSIKIARKKHQSCVLFGW